MTREDKLRELQRLEDQVGALRTELEPEPGPGPWAPSGYYLTYHLIAGMILGFFGAAVSLLCNVLGSLLVGQHPLLLIKVYLTFPLGEEALRMDSGLALAVGCVLYLGTGMLYGILFHVVLTRYLSSTPLQKQLAAMTLLGLALWLVNYYAILSWLQPLLIGGAWIVQMVPWWVGALTHLAFAWTMLLIKDWGRFDPTADAART